MARTDKESTSSLEARAVHAIRALTIDATQAAGSGHPGMPMGAAPMGYLLYRRFMTHNPKNPHWWNRDRYVQSAGHGSMLQYSLLHLTGYDLSMQELRDYRQWGSKTPGHPEVHLTPGVETTTGPLGQGFATAVGMALAEAHLAARFNRQGHDIVDHWTWVIASDGDLMEGISHEAASFAGHHGLGKLIVFYDDNHISIDGPTSITYSDDVLQRFGGYDWHTQRVEDGNDLAALSEALENAKQERLRPSLIAVRTTIGYGAPTMAGTSEVHGSPLGEEEAEATKRALGIDWPAFTVPDDVLDHYREVVAEGEAAEARWKRAFESYRDDHPELAAEFERVMQGHVPDGFDADLPNFPVGKSLATRKASQQALNAVAKRMPELIGGSADLAGSNYTDIDGASSLERGDYAGRIVHFGVREHAMAAIGNGMSLHGGVRPFVGTFLIFSDYLRPALRLSALMEQPVIYVLTHDSVGLGGDGPTHQPVEHLMSLRAIPNLLVLRPADGNETAQAWAIAARRTDGPTALALTRQGVPHLDVPAGAVAKGAYVVADAEGTPDVLLIATGSEVHVCLEAQAQLADEGIQARVVSMPSFELFERQDASYREQILPTEVRARVAVEAGRPLGWERWVGTHGAIVGIDTFGASAEGDVVLEKYGFTATNVAEHAKRVLG